MYLLALLSLLPIPSDSDVFRRPCWPPAPLGSESPALSESSGVSDDEDEQAFGSESFALSESSGVSDDEGEQAFGYDYVEIGIQSIDGGEFDNRTSFGCGFSKSLQDSIYVMGSLVVSPYQDAGDGPVSPAAVSVSFGGGAHFSVTGATDIFAEAAFVNRLVEDGLGSSVHSDGFESRFGVRQRIVGSVELQLSILSLNLDGNDSVQSTAASSIFHLSDRESVIISVIGEDFDFDSSIGFAYRISI